jgi:ribosomal protein S18 acetylase RimI-like enzyme
MPTLRPYRAADWSSFLELDLETGLASLTDATPEQREAFRRRWPDELREMYRWSDDGPTTRGSKLLVLETDDGAYAGHLWLTEQIDFFTGEGKLFITTVALRAEHRGRGWGRLLMQRAEDEARARGLGRIGLGVDAANAGAIGLYEQLGYRTTRRAMEKKLT